MTSAVTKISAHGPGFIKNLLQEWEINKLSWGLAEHPRAVALLKSSGSSVAITCTNHVLYYLPHAVDSDVLCYSF